MRLRILACAILFEGGVFASQALALTPDVQVGDVISFTNGPGDTNGGEFGVKNPAGVGADKFITFCVQTGEFLDFDPAGFKVKSVTTATIVGSVPLTDTVAFLYTKFRDGTLPGYDHSPAKADDLQRAIWYYMGASGGATNAYTTLADDATTVGGITDEWVGKGLGNVRIANLLWATDRGHGLGDAQDVLVLVPTPTASLAGAGLLTSLAGLGYIRRRKTSEMI